jgi:hypothetical protein
MGWFSSQQTYLNSVSCITLLMHSSTIHDIWPCTSLTCLFWMSEHKLNTKTWGSSTSHSIKSELRWGAACCIMIPKISTVTPVPKYSSHLLMCQGIPRHAQCHFSGPKLSWVLHLCHSHKIVKKQVCTCNVPQSLHLCIEYDHTHCSHPGNLQIFLLTAQITHLPVFGSA